MKEQYDSMKAYWYWRGIADAMLALGEMGMIDAMNALQPAYDKACEASAAADAIADAELKAALAAAGA